MIDAFVTNPPHHNGGCKKSTKHPSNPRPRSDSYDCHYPLTTSLLARYGPPDDTDAVPSLLKTTNNEDHNPRKQRKEQLKSEFTSILHKLMNSTTPSEDIPSLVTQNIQMILEVLGSTSSTTTNDDDNNGNSGSDEIEVENAMTLLEEIILDDVQNYHKTHGNDSDSSNNHRLEQITDAVNLLLSFVETFVEQTSTMDDTYKKLLGSIFTSIAPSSSNKGVDSSTSSSSSSADAAMMEEQLDGLLSSSSEAFTPGFLRHVEGECLRISSLKTLSPESARMLEILRVIQTRILEELGKGIGEGAVVLGQLLGYDNEAERLAVLDAGLAVRGVDFAHELAALTQEALDGFDVVNNQQSGGGEGVDPELVSSVKGIDERIRKFIGHGFSIKCQWALCWNDSKMGK